MTVNGLVLESAGATLTVGPQQAAATRQRPAAAPLQGLGLLDQLFGKPKPQDYVEPQDQAFLALVTDKASAYSWAKACMWGCTSTSRPKTRRCSISTILPGQLPDIIRQLRQRTVWEESFDEQEIVPETVTVGGKPFLRYRLWEAELLPAERRAAGVSGRGAADAQVQRGQKARRGPRQPAGRLQNLPLGGPHGARAGPAAPPPARPGAGGQL